MVFQKKVAQILRQNDPMGLIRVGCPGDEYSIEAEKLSKALVALKVKSQFEVVRALVKVFDHSFLKGSTEIIRCYRIADQLLEALRSHGSKKS